MHVQVCVYMCVYACEYVGVNTHAGKSRILALFSVCLCLIGLRESLMGNGCSKLLLGWLVNGLSGSSHYHLQILKLQGTHNCVAFYTGDRDLNLQIRVTKSHENYNINYLTVKENDYSYQTRPPESHSERALSRQLIEYPSNLYWCLSRWSGASKRVRNPWWCPRACCSHCS